MTLQTSGTISIEDIYTEFGGGRALSEYYRGGSYVPNVPTNYNIPTSGAIALSDFYGASVIVPTSFTLTSSTSITITAGVHTFYIGWMIGGGGGGGSGTESGAGGGGGGGSSGSYAQHLGPYGCNPGDVITIAVGGGGGPSGAGGATSIYQNGVLLLQVGGGNPGGNGAPRYGGPGGVAAVGGAILGNNGAPGEAGTSDSSSGHGGTGGSSPWGTGGAFGTGTSSAASYGHNASGYGAGGGGAGFADRQNPLNWPGGSGTQGWLHFSYPTNF